MNILIATTINEVGVTLGIFFVIILFYYNYFYIILQIFIGNCNYNTKTFISQNVLKLVVTSCQKINNADIYLYINL